MEEKFEDEKKLEISSEADRYRASAESHKEALKSLWSTFATTGVIMILIIVFIAFGGFGWFVSNTQVHGASGGVFAKGQADFALATVGSKSQGVYDTDFHLSDDLSLETFGDTTYYVSSGNSSFRVDSSKNFNNYLANADLRPGNRGTFDLYIICRTSKRDLVLNPVFSSWCDGMSSTESSTNQNEKNAAEFLKGHILFFANMDDKGMYSGNIDLEKEIEINLSISGEGSRQLKDNATQKEESKDYTFSWGECVYSDATTAVYRLPVYWVWPEEFGNFIYTGNSYNKNLFLSKDSPDYNHFISVMQSDTSYNHFFYIDAGKENNRPDISAITSEDTDYKIATEYYELYSGWYDAADEEIGTYISYIELGFEIVTKQ